MSGKPIEIIYVDRHHQFSKRTVKLREICGEHVKAYCYQSRSPRTFKLTHILATLPSPISPRSSGKVE
jgi:hypothetical protein